MSDVLMEITKENLETGLRGYPIGYCTTSHVDPNKGLSYCGRSIADLAYEEPENVIYLLYYGKEGSNEEVAAFKKELSLRAKLKAETVKGILALPKAGHPTKLFCAALLVAGMSETTGDYREDCLNLIAKAPEISALVINYHAGWGGINPSNPSLGYIENFTQMLKAPNANFDNLNSAFKLFNVLHYDHGGGNLSTFVGKAVASGLEDMYGSISAAMCALAGPKHGRANQDCLEFVEKFLKEVGDSATPAQIEEHIRNKLKNDELVFGFGHAVLRVEDARASILYSEAEKRYPNHPLVKLTKQLRTIGPKVLAENPKIADPYPNVDAISGTLLTAAGFPYPDYFTVLFGLSRIVGIAIQIVYERCEARGGKGTPIVRPKYYYMDRDQLVK